MGCNSSKTTAEPSSAPQEKNDDENVVEDVENNDTPDAPAKAADKKSWVLIKQFLTERKTCTYGHRLYYLIYSINLLQYYIDLYVQGSVQYVCTRECTYAYASTLLLRLIFCRHLTHYTNNHLYHYPWWYNNHHQYHHRHTFSLEMIYNLLEKG